MSVYREQVAAALGAVAIRGPWRYAWLGRGSRLLPAELREELDDAARREFLHGCLSDELYWSFYCRGGVGPARWGEAEPVNADPLLAAAVADAVVGRGGLESGWSVERLDGGEAVVASSRLRARVPAEYGWAPGTAVSVERPALLPALSPGYLTLRGDRGSEAGGGVVRVYWHITSRGAAPLVRALSARLNGDGVPFRLKVLDHPLRYDRCDAAVLYLRDASYPPLRGSLATLAAELAPYLRPAIPAFTLPLAPGVGLAEDEGAGTSFGERRCALLAAGMLDGAGIAGVFARFTDAGVEVDAPYREPALAGRHVL